jgi:hypothetical protein
LTNGFRIAWRTPTGGANSGAATVNVNGLGAVQLTKNQNNALTGGESQEGGFNFAVYNQPNNRFELQTPKAAGTNGQFTYNNAGANAGSSLLNQSGGAIGIGTASPQNALHLHNAASAAVYNQITNGISGSAVTDGLLCGLDISGNAILWHQEALALIFATNNQERFRVNSSGRILINGAADTNPHFNQTVGTMAFNNGAGPNAWNTFKAKGCVTTAAATGTYSQIGTTLITVTMAAHGLDTGDYVQLDFTTGTATDMGGYCTVVNANTFTVIGSTSVTTSGNVTKLSHCRPAGSPFALSFLRTAAGQGDFYFNAGVFADARYGLMGNGFDATGAKIVCLRTGGTRTTTQASVNFTSTAALADVTDYTLAFI